METLMEFLNLPGVLPVMLGVIGAFVAIMTAFAFVIRSEGRRRERASELRWQAAFEKAKAEAATLVEEAKRKADEAKAELQEGQTIAETLRLLVKLQERSLIQQETNQEHNRAEREESRKAHIEALDRVTDTFSTRQGQLAGNLAANTEAMTLMASRVDTINTSVGTSASAIQADLSALTKAVNELITSLKSNKACEEQVAPLLTEIKGQLSDIQRQMVSTPVPDELDKSA
jgi:hypothetical protein